LLGTGHAVETMPLIRPSRHTQRLRAGEAPVASSVLTPAPRPTTTPPPIDRQPNGFTQGAGMSSPRLDEIAALIAQHDVHTVELATIDTYGHLRGKRVPAGRFVRTVAERGAHIADAIYVMDVQCEIVDSPLINMGTGFLDMHLGPSCRRSASEAPPGYATVMTNSIDHEHKPHHLDLATCCRPRSTVRHRLTRSPRPSSVLHRNDDWTPAQSNVQYSSLIDSFRFGRCVADMRRAARPGDPFEVSNPEYGPGQLEINFGPADPMRTADNTILFKATIKEIARNHGLRATFMPKPYAGQSGNGMHVHTSLSQGGRNVFDGGDGHLLNDVFRHWVGGLIHLARSISLMGIP
jgi:glutamine synthetase